MAAAAVNTDFPVWALLPKKETGVDSFLSKYPKYDGRGIKIAIFDSGVDPGAPGLQMTSDGRKKVVERYDCSGAGDVDTSIVVQANNDGNIVGVSGRLLKIPTDWTNPSGQFHIGIVNCYDLYPAKLRERIEKYRKEKLWDPGFKKAFADTMRKLQDFEKETPQVTTLKDKFTKEDLEIRMELLSSLEKKYCDPGPAFDCVIFHDGICWRACLDTSECGDMTSCKLLGEYSVTHDYAAISTVDQFNYSINVHNDGNTLEVVGMCSSHGTHVASIAAAYFEDSSEKNGIAPGAQIVSFTIGDNRLNSMETGTSLVRAMIQVMQRQNDPETRIHIINMSYGEHTHFSSSGRIGELMAEVIDKHGLIWVASAGNNGPALCTIGTPPDICTNNVIGVGAYVSSDMMMAEYAMCERLPSMPYTWSSRGPTIDGDLGVSVCAPGGAITSVPNFTLRNSQLMNGTSMSAPHVSGAVALLLSGLNKENIPYSPYSIKRAMENTAQFSPAEVFSSGHGLLQVEKAFENLSLYHDASERDVRFNVTCGPNNNKGIHLRSGLQDAPTECSVNVEPIFLNTENIEPKNKIIFGMKLTLACPDSWVQCPTHLDISNISRGFIVKINPMHLPTGLHHTSIDAFDVTCVDKGAVFRVPITVIRPQKISARLHRPELESLNTLFYPNYIRRNFVLVPENATWAVLKLHCRDKDKSGRFVIHAVQLRPKLVCKTLEFHKICTVSSQNDVFQGFSVRGGLVLELVIAKYWANIGEVALDYSMSFHGVKPDNSLIAMQGAEGVFSVELSSRLRSEQIAPSASLKNSVQMLRPNEAKIVPLSARDVIPQSRQIYELQLSYNFHISKGTEIVPISPLLSDLLYESEFESQLWMLFDCNKHLMAAGDAYPTKYMVKVEKGDYILKMHVRHERKELLDKLLDKQLLLSQKLAVPISLDIYASLSRATTGGKKMSVATISQGQILPVYIAPLNHEKSSKIPLGAQFLTGTITYAHDEIGKKVDTYPIKYVLPEPFKKPTSVKLADLKDDKKTKWDEYQEAAREMKINWLAKLDTIDKAYSLYEEMNVAYKENLHVHIAMLQCLDPPLTKKQLAPLTEGVEYPAASLLSNIVTISDLVIKAVDQTKLLAFFGTKNDSQLDAAKTKSLMEKQKSAFLDALGHKGAALCRLYNITHLKRDSIDAVALTDLDTLWPDILKFTDAMDSKVIYYSLWYASINAHYGRLLKILYRLMEESPCQDLDVQIAATQQNLGWQFCSDLTRLSRPIRFPTTYRLF